MKPAANFALILVTSDNADDARQILRQPEGDSRMRITRYLPVRLRGMGARVTSNN